MKTRTEITVEMDRVIVVNRSRKSESSSSSSRPVETPSVDNAALVAALLKLLKETKDDDRPED